MVDDRSKLDIADASKIGDYKIAALHVFFRTLPENC